MKKYLFTTLMLLTMLFASVGHVAAAPNAANYPVLISVEYVPNVGPVFIFSVAGKLSKAELHGSLHVDGEPDTDLYCKQVDDLTIRCIASKAIENVNVVVHFGKFIFWAYVPPAVLLPTQYCYNVYDWTLDESGDWMSFGTYCQDSPAQYGDMINWYNPGWEDFYDYEFLPGTPGCPFVIDEDAYYYPDCPDSSPL